jgi:hypothetical protein
MVMAELPLPLQFLAAWIGTWVARHQERSIAYLKVSQAGHAGQQAVVPQHHQTVTPAAPQEDARADRSGA